jgi:hypothetical protein
MWKRVVRVFTSHENLRVTLTKFYWLQGQIPILTEFDPPVKILRVKSGLLAQGQISLLEIWRVKESFQGSNRHPGWGRDTAAVSTRCLIHVWVEIQPVVRFNISVSFHNSYWCEYGLIKPFRKYSKYDDWKVLCLCTPQKMRLKLIRKQYS